MHRDSQRRLLACRTLVACAWLVAAASLTGCSFNLPLAKNSLGPGGRSPSMTADDYVAKINLNIERLHSWRCANVGISGRGMPMRLSGQIAVEQPRNFRLVASVLGSEEADFGSNAQSFWFWVKRNQPAHIFTARHEDVAHSQALKQIPFEADWLMEALGVVPLDSTGMTLDPVDKRTVHLISERMTPAGVPVKRVIVVNDKFVVLGQSLYDSRGGLIAKATMSGHRAEKYSSIVMPHQIVMEWPQAGTSIKLVLGEIETNPPALSSHTFDVPQKTGYMVYDIGAATRGRRSQSADIGHVKFDDFAPDRPAGVKPAPAKGFDPPDEWSTPLRADGQQDPAGGMPSELFEQPPVKTSPRSSQPAADEENPFAGLPDDRATRR